MRDNASEPAKICAPKVFLIIYNPVVDTAGHRPLSSFMNWQRPDSLVGNFIAEVQQASGGLVRYQIAQRVELNEFPEMVGGTRYNLDTYQESLKRGASRTGMKFDYAALVTRFGLLQRIGRGEFDEVWVMAMAFANGELYESVMGGAGAFWCNAPMLAGTEACRRRFVIMGFSYERQLGEMLHSYNHRAESILGEVFNAMPFLQWAYNPNRQPATVGINQPLNAFQRFCLFEQIAPGRAGVGTIHYAPNSIRDYDLSNPKPVRSTCYDWLSFPNLRGDVRLVSSTEWGGNEAGYQSWWMRHLPKAVGRQDGIHNNWWQYIANLDNIGA